MYCIFQNSKMPSVYKILRFVGDGEIQFAEEQAADGTWSPAGQDRADTRFDSFEAAKNICDLFLADGGQVVIARIILEDQA